MALLFFLLFCLTTYGQELYFQMEDEAEDEAASYPSASFFHPGSGFFDLLQFQVAGEGEELVFDFTFARVANPWEAPEGFSHQLIDLYLDTAPGGRCEPRLTGAGVTFPQEHGWEYQLRIMPWGGSAFYNLKDESFPVQVYLLPDGKTIRGKIALNLVGTPKEDWGYYVLVGSYDGFAPDNYRPQTAKAGVWSFGGSGRTNVLDLLAPKGEGVRSQRAQLENGELWPVGPGLNKRPQLLFWFTILLLIIFVGFECFRLQSLKAPPN